MPPENARMGDAMCLRPHNAGRRRGRAGRWGTLAENAWHGGALPHGGEVASGAAAVVGRGVGRAVPTEGGNEERWGEEIETAKKSSVGGGASERHSSSSS